MAVLKKQLVILTALASFINQICAQQWVWDEIYEEQLDTPSEDFTLGGLICLCVLIGLIWFISKCVKIAKEEHRKKMELRKKNEKKTDDILSNMDHVIDCINHKAE